RGRPGSRSLRAHLWPHTPHTAHPPRGGCVRAHATHTSPHICSLVFPGISHPMCAMCALCVRARLPHICAVYDCANLCLAFMDYNVCLCFPPPGPARECPSRALFGCYPATPRSTAVPASRHSTVAATSPTWVLGSTIGSSGVGGVGDHLQSQGVMACVPPVML